VLTSPNGRRAALDVSSRVLRSLDWSLLVELRAVLDVAPRNSLALGGVKAAGAGR
jgi:hypothetical protein